MLGDFADWTTQREESRARQFSWTAKGQLAAVTQDGFELSRSWYDGQGSRRVHRSALGGTQSLVTYPADELTSVDEERTVHVFFGDQRVASHRPRANGHYGEVSWFHQDYLGSTNFVSDEYAAVHGQVEYFPSGEPWYEHRDEQFQLKAPSFLFTGKEYERSTGLDAFGFRHYDPVIGQWISPDPAMAEFYQTDLAGGVFEPRNLATYSYAWNNPVGVKDPDGRIAQPLLQNLPRIVQSLQRVGPAFERYFRRASHLWNRLGPRAQQLTKGVVAELAQGWATREASGEEHTVGAIVADVVAGVLGARFARGNSTRSTRAQHGYEIVDTRTREIVKIGLSGGRRTKDGGSYRANSQANRWNRQEGTDGRYVGRVVAEFPAGPGARQRALDWEEQSAQHLRANEHLRRRDKHKRP